MLLCHYAEQKRIMDKWLAIFVFFLLCSVSISTFCLHTVHKLYAHALSRFFFSIFGEFQVPPIVLEYELKCVVLFTMDPFGRKYSWSDAKEDGGASIISCMPAEHPLHALLPTIHSFHSFTPCSTLPGSIPTGSLHNTHTHTHTHGHCTVNTDV